MLNGLDVCSGIGGLSLALKEWVKTVCYCEIDRYCQAVIASRIWSGELENAPIWDDIRTLASPSFREATPIDILSGGFPCQDISVAGNGEGLEGKRSGLFFEIIRLVKDMGPEYVFLENVPAITTRGGVRVISELTSLGYDCRWTMVSAAELGAPHLRRRFFLLAHSQRSELRNKPRGISRQSREGSPKFGNDGAKESLADSDNTRLQNIQQSRDGQKQPLPYGVSNKKWWAIEPNVGRVVNGLPFRVDRVKALGNSVVPIQAREAFRRLMGIKQS